MGGHATASPAAPVRGLARRRERPAPRRRNPRAAAAHARATALPHLATTAADRARLRRRAHQAHAPDRRPPRPDRLPAPAPRAGRRRHLVGRRSRSRDAGTYRVFADFSHDGEPRARSPPTCASTAPADLRPLPAPAADARSATAATTSRLDAERGAARASEADLRFTVTTRRRAGRRPSPTSAPAATSSRCARATSRSCTSTPTDGQPTAMRLRGDVPDRGPLPPVPAVPARRAASTPPRSPRR